MRKNDIHVASVEEIEKEDRVTNEAREKIKKRMAKKQIDIENEKLKDETLTDRKRKNIEKKIKKLKIDAGVTESKQLLRFSEWNS